MMRSVQSTCLVIGNLGKGALLILQAQAQILMMRSHHGKSKKGRSSSSTDTDDEYNIRAKHRSHHKRSKKRGRTALLRLLPKNLSYDGKTNWLAFKQKFTRYATACEWTSEECLNCLCWCLTDKAADFYAILMEGNEHLTYRRLMCRLEKHFGIKELAETAQTRFRQATQMTCVNRSFRRD